MDIKELQKIIQVSQEKYVLLSKIDALFIDSNFVKHLVQSGNLI